MEIKSGTRVIVLEDFRFPKKEIESRDGNKATGMQGTVEEYGSLKYNESWWNSPYIRLDDGDTIWGYECWWAPVEAVESLSQAQRGLQKLKAELRDRLDYG